MKRKTKYKGVVDPGKIPNTRTDLPDLDTDLASLLPDYVRKHSPDYVKKYYPRPKHIMTATQLKLFCNPSESINEFNYD